MIPQLDVAEYIHRLKGPGNDALTRQVVRAKGIGNLRRVSRQVDAIIRYIDLEELEKLG